MRELEESKVTYFDPTREMADAVQWGAKKESAYRLSLRNTGRIEQLEAGHQDLKEFVTAILRAAASEATYERSRWKWDSPTDIEGRPVAETYYLVDSWAKSVGKLATGGVVRQLAEMETPYAGRFSEVGKLYSELKEDFEDIGQRIARCALLEESLGVLEDDLDDEEGEYLSWCVSLLRDVLDYNYAEDLTKDRLDALGRGIETICTERLSCDRESYRELHKGLLATGVALLPTSRKAQEKYGQKESGDGEEKLLFS